MLGGPEPESLTSTSNRSAWWPPVGWSREMVVLAIVATGLVLILGLALGLRPFLGRPSQPEDSTGTRATDEPVADTGSGDTFGNHESDIVVCIETPGTTEPPKETPARDLADAIQLAMGSLGYVKLRNREPLCLEAGKLIDLGSAGNRTVDIRGVPGMAPPVIEIQMGGGPFLATTLTVSLSLSGLDIHVHYPPNPADAGAAPTPVIDAGGPVTIHQCAFEVIGDPPPNGGLALASSSLVLTVDRCWFEGFDTAIDIQSFEGTVAKIRQTMIVPRPRLTERRGWGVELHLAPGGEKPKVVRRLVLEHCTLEGAGFVQLVPAAVQLPLEIEVKQCAVRAEWLLAWKPLKPEDHFATQFHWHGEGNQFEIRGNSWIVLSREGTPALSAEATDLDSWSKVAAQERDPIRTALHYRIDPALRTVPLRPNDFAIDSLNPPGADPEQVGPWSH